MATGTSNREDDLARLRSELEQADIRLEEVTTYYRGQLEAVRRRAEDETVRVQASEAGRRRRAEEQVAYLKGELNAARTDAEHAQRRYQELLHRLEEVELEGREQTQAEVDRHQSAAKAAWRTAEEEVERLDGELSALQRKLEQEREQRHQLERGYEQLEERHHLQDEERKRLISRLKRVFKLSEQRRTGLETELRNVQHRLERARVAQERTRRAGAEGRAGLVSPELASIEVDPAAGWGSLRLGEDDGLADEFLMMAADESLDAAPAGSAEREERRGPVPGELRAGSGEPEEEVSDQEAETLMMKLDVDRKVAQRQADAARRRPQVAAGPAVPPPLVEPSFMERWKWGMVGGIGACLALFLGVALALL